jgi:AcrR family transcriptional regulator
VISEETVTAEERRKKWIEAGLAALARGGVEEVRVEVLAKDLGVTKGGFYRSFPDRRALLKAILENWGQGRIAAIEKQAHLDGGPPRERLRELIGLYSGRFNPRGMAIELAIRQWARTDDDAGRIAAKVDAVRLKSVAELYGALGLPREEAEARAFLFYSFIFGQSLLHLNESSPHPGRLISACAALLTDEIARECG